MLDTIDALQDGKSMVQLVQSMGDDKMVCHAARVSHGKDQLGESFEDGRDNKLINFLAKHRHGTPFEHNSMTFMINAPLFVVRQWHRHRIGWSYNEISRRYTEFELEFYFPDRLRGQSESNRQASDGFIDLNVNAVLMDAVRRTAATQVKLYEAMLEKGVAKEQARMVLPQNMYCRMYATCNLRSLAHFHGLRYKPDAQWEIAQYAGAMGELAGKLFPVSWKALTRYGT